MTSSADNKIDTFLEGVPAEERPALKEYVSLPNSPDIQPEMMALRARFGQALSSVSNKVEQLRQDTGLTYDELRERLLSRIRN